MLHLVAPDQSISNNLANLNSNLQVMEKPSDLVEYREYMRQQNYAYQIGELEQISEFKVFKGSIKI
jgi:hypothetical protein